MKTIEKRYIADCGYIDMDMITMETWCEINPDVHPLETVGYNENDIPDDMDDWSEEMYTAFSNIMDAFKARLKIIKKEFVEDGNKGHKGEDVPDPCPVYNLTIEIN